ncbi:phosphoinositide 3-kinase adapter protein 1 isoform X1 [Oncorhynchus tshawytscha]|uniref:DBB domain-containing protein n=2 Tax=Oncorhynchus tshawytscha TaxID=74940 RepID=A0AAZ3SPB2_ONCTS|nr:phosphoinositide 3-kinase adapter protein 1 isoform X1 [Oncorhynchus tshawytscha]
MQLFSNFTIMDGVVSPSESAMSGFHSTCELLIVHSCEAQEWATYLQKILKSSRKFPKRSIVLYAVDSADQLHGCELNIFYNSKCIVLLLTTAILDILNDPEVLGTFQRLLHPPHRVVALLCGMSGDDVPTEWFENWQSWRKLYAEDEPALYISTILESIADCNTEEAEHEAEATAKTEAKTEREIPVVMNPKAEGTEEESVTEPECVQDDNDDVRTEIHPNQEMSPTQPTCLTVQPNRVLCGDHATIFIIFSNKLDNQLKMEVVFASEDSTAKRVLGILENEYTISINAPDMPAGEVSLTLYSNDSPVCLRPVTYYTAMGEISRYLQHAAAPLNFMCQAFNLTSNTTESLDNLLTDSLQCRIPASGLHVFGIRQLEEDNMAAYQRKEELPTLLHFAAKYGLKKLTTVLLQCPGALQAYSVMNKNGDYPNTLAERSGFSELRQFIDYFVETAGTAEEDEEVYESNSSQDIMNDSLNPGCQEDIYETMSNSSQDIMNDSLNPGCQEDIYETMTELNHDSGEDLYEDMEKALGESHNPEEVILRTFFQGKPDAGVPQVGEDTTDEEVGDQVEEPEGFEDEELYNMCVSDQIYDTLDESASYLPEIVNRPPAPIPRPVTFSEPEESKTYISRVFSAKEESSPQTDLRETESFTVRPVRDGASTSSSHDPYAEVKTQGQRQLIALQEKVKVGVLSVDDAVKEFKAWQFDEDRRSQSLRNQQENLKRLRGSITRRHKEREKIGKEIGLEITAPLQRNLPWGANMAVECSVYESTPRVIAQPPPVIRSSQRDTWKTGSTSSTSSTGSNRLSTHSTISYSSGTEPDIEDTADFLPLPPLPLPPLPLPPRPAEAAPLPPPPRIPPRLPDRAVESLLEERYVSYPSRALPQRPPQRNNSPPLIPRRTR